MLCKCVSMTIIRATRRGIFLSWIMLLDSRRNKVGAKAVTLESRLNVALSDLGSHWLHQL